MAILRQTQVLQVPNTFFGLAFAPDGNRFYVSGGVDDNVHVFARANGVWTETGAPIALGHKAGAGFHGKPMVANLAVTRGWQGSWSLPISLTTPSRSST